MSVSVSASRVLGVFYVSLCVSWCGLHPVRWAVRCTTAELEANTGTCLCVRTFLGKKMIIFH